MTMLRFTVVALCACQLQFHARSGTTTPSAGSSEPAPAPAAIAPRADHDAWAEQCFADYAAFRTAWEPIETKARQTIASTQSMSIYAALPILRALYISLKPKAIELGLEGGASLYNAVDDGIAYEVAVAIHELQKRTHHTEWPLFHATKFPRGHAATGDAAYDRNHYCARAWNLGTHLHQARDYDYEERRISTPWLSAAAAQTFYASEVAFVDKTNKLFNDVDAQKPPDNEYGIVKSIRRGKTGTTVVLSHSEIDTVCVKTNRIRRIHDDGTVEYDSDCYNKPLAWKYNVTVTIADAPELAVGDDIVVTGTERDNHAFTASLVTNWSRGKKTLFEFSAPD